MKNILVIIVCLMNFRAMAEPEKFKNILENDKGFDVLRYNYIGVFMWKYKGANIKPLEIFDNEQLKGTPVYIIDGGKLIRKSEPQAEYLLEFDSDIKQEREAYHKKCMKNIKLVPEFATSGGDCGEYYLRISDFKGDILRMEEKGKSLYLKLSKSDRKTYVSRARARVYKGKEAKVLLDKYFLTDKNVSNFFTKGKECAKKEDAKCYQELAGRKEYNPYDDETMLKYYNILQDINLCKYMDKGRIDASEDNIIPEEKLPVKITKYPFKELAMAMELDSSKVDILFGMHLDSPRRLHVSVLVKDKICHKQYWLSFEVFAIVKQPTESEAKMTIKLVDIEVI